MLDKILASSSDDQQEVDSYDLLCSQGTMHTYFF